MGTRIECIALVALMEYTQCMGYFRSKTSSWLALVLIAMLQLGHFGCGGKPIEEGDPGDLFKEAEEDINSDHYQLAVDKLKVIKNKYPYSKYALDASLRLADVYFLQESYVEAALAYESFRDLHPKHPKAAYAMFRIGLSYYNDLPSTIARDLADAKKAEDAFNDFIHHFPSDPNVAEAKKDLAEARGQMADKELYIGDFYFKRHFYDSAKGRYEKIVEIYPEAHAADTAREKLAKIEKDNLHNEEP
jgi:outer membrane protein assembly factor BamD